MYFGEQKSGCCRRSAGRFRRDIVSKPARRKKLTFQNIVVNAIAMTPAARASRILRVTKRKPTPRRLNSFSMATLCNTAIPRSSSIPAMPTTRGPSIATHMPPIDSTESLPIRDLRRSETISPRCSFAALRTTIHIPYTGAFNLHQATDSPIRATTFELNP